MKVQLLAILLISISSRAVAVSCPEETKFDSFQSIVENASDIFLGTVTSGVLTQSGASHNLEFSVHIEETLKGNLAGDIDLENTRYIHGFDAEISIGEVYLIFLYGSLDVDFCNHIWKMGLPYEILKEGEDIPELVQDSQGIYLINGTRDALRKAGTP